MERKMKKKQVGLTTLAATLMISGMTLTQVNAKDELKVTMPVINPTPKTVNTLGNGMEISSFVNLIGADAVSYTHLSFIIIFIIHIFVCNIDFSCI